VFNLGESGQDVQDMQGAIVVCFWKASIAVFLCAKRPSAAPLNDETSV